MDPGSEIILLQLWRELVKNVTDEILQKIWTPDELHYQRMHKHINRLLLFMISFNEDGVIFPPKEIISSNTHYFNSLTAYYYKFSDQEIKIITDIIIRHCDIQSKKFIGREKIKADVKKKIKGDFIVLACGSQHEKVSKKHYHELKNKFILDHGFDEAVWILLHRYNLFMNEKVGMCLSDKTLFSFIKKNKLDDITLEGYAGSLNSNLKNYCSLFPDIERLFGSKGSLYNFREKLDYKIVTLNPPYTYPHIIMMKNIALEMLKNNKVTIIITIPDFREEGFPPYDELKKSRYFFSEFAFKKYNYYSFFTSKNIVMPFANTLIMILCSADDRVYAEMFRGMF